MNETSTRPGVLTMLTIIVTATLATVTLTVIERMAGHRDMVAALALAKKIQNS